MTAKNNLDAYQCVMEDVTAVILDMTNILEVTKVETLQKTIENMTVTIPNLKSIPAVTKVEAFQKTIKNMATTTSNGAQRLVATNKEVFQNEIENMIATATDLTNMLATTRVETFQNAMKNIPHILPKITEMFSVVDWDRFEPTDEDLKKAQEILWSENIEVVVSKGLSEKQAEKELSNSFKMVLLVSVLLYYTLEFISNVSTMAFRECTHHKIIPVVESVMNVEQSNKLNTEKQTLKQLNEELKKKCSY